MSNEQAPPKNKSKNKAGNTPVIRTRKQAIVDKIIVIISIILAMVSLVAILICLNMYKIFLTGSYEAASQQTLQSLALAQGAHQVDHHRFLNTGTKSDYEGLTKYALQKDLNLNYGRIYADDVEGQPGFYVQVNHRSGGRSWFWASRDPGVKEVTKEAVAKYTGLNIKGVKGCEPPSWWDNFWDNEQLKSENAWCD